MFKETITKPSYVAQVRQTYAWVNEISVTLLLCNGSTLSQWMESNVIGHTRVNEWKVTQWVSAELMNKEQRNGLHLGQWMKSNVMGLTWV